MLTLNGKHKARGLERQEEGLRGRVRGRLRLRTAAGHLILLELRLRRATRGSGEHRRRACRPLEAVHERTLHEGAYPVRSGLAPGSCDGEPKELPLLDSGRPSTPVGRGNPGGSPGSLRSPSDPAGPLSQRPFLDPPVPASTQSSGHYPSVPTSSRALTRPEVSRTAMSVVA